MSIRFTASGAAYRITGGMAELISEDPAEVAALRQWDDTLRQWDDNWRTQTTRMRRDR